VLTVNKRLSALLDSDAVKGSLSSVLSILFGLFVGCLIILAVSLSDSDFTLKSAAEGIKLLLFGVFSKGRDASGELVFGFSTSNIGNLLFRATPVIMTGLSVALAFRSGLFNIGASGQFLIGTATCLTVALSLDTKVFPPLAVWLIAFIAAGAAGALWGIIPGLLRAYLSINEVLSCIMTNWIAANLVTWFFENSPLRNAGQSGKIGYIMPTSANGVSTPTLFLDRLFPSSQVNGGFFVAIFFCIAAYILLTKTVTGFEMRICGSNSHAAHYVGIRQKKMTVFSFALAGALSGGAAALYYLSGHTEFFWSTYQTLPQEGLSGIPVALLASNNPLGVIFTSLFMSLLGVSGQQLKNLTAFNEFTTDIVVALIVYLSAFSLVIRQYLSKDRRNLIFSKAAGGKTNRTVPVYQGQLKEEGEEKQ